MTRLKCNALNCASNKDNCCCQPGIKVQGMSAVQKDSTRCQSFVEKFSGEMSNATCFSQPNIESDVKCTACNCVHNNKHGDCKAESIDIDGPCACETSGTKCNSFKCDSCS